MRLMKFRHPHAAWTMCRGRWTMIEDLDGVFVNPEVRTIYTGGAFRMIALVSEDGTILIARASDLTEAS